MVQSSYKNRKKNRKQSFKRKNTDGNRKVKFIEDDDDKMVGGDLETDRTNIKTALNQYTKHPLFGIILAAFSNADCASSDVDGQCSTTHMSALIPSYNKCKEILKSLPELSEDGHKKPQAPVSPDNGTKLAHVKAVIDYLFQNVFIPKGLIKNVYVQNDDGTNWTTLTNTKFVEVESGADTASNQRAAAAAGETTRRLNTEPDDGERGEHDEIYITEETRELDSSRHTNTAGSGNSGQQESALAPNGAETPGLGQEQNVDNVAANNEGLATENMSVQRSSVSGQQQQNPETAVAAKPKDALMERFDLLRR